MAANPKHVTKVASEVRGERTVTVISLVDGSVAEVAAGYAEVVSALAAKPAKKKPLGGPPGP